MDEIALRGCAGWISDLSYINLDTPEIDQYT